MISTRGRYALRVMTELSLSGGGCVPLRDVAQHQGMSLKYLESILARLVKAGLVEGTHGKSGGYRLTRSPADYTVYEILLAAEGSLAPVECLKCGETPCERADLCRTLPLWKKLETVMGDYLKSVSLEDVAEGREV